MKSGGEVKVSACKPTPNKACPKVNAELSEKTTKKKPDVKFEIGTGYQNAFPSAYTSQGHTMKISLGLAGGTKRVSGYMRAFYARSILAKDDLLPRVTMDTIGVMGGARVMLWHNPSVIPFISAEIGAGVSVISDEGAYPYVGGGLSVGVKMPVTKHKSLIVDIAKLMVAYQDRKTRRESEAINSRSMDNSILLSLGASITLQF